MSEPEIFQIDKFYEATRQLETDDAEERFEEKLCGIVKQKPENHCMRKKGK